MIFDNQTHIPLHDNGTSKNEVLNHLSQLAGQCILGARVCSYHKKFPEDPNDFPVLMTDDTGGMIYFPEINSTGKIYSPAKRIADAMGLLHEIGKIEYLKWRISDSYYHGTCVFVFPPSEGQSGHREGMRESFSWCCNDDELPEHITRAVLYAMGADVAVHDVYNLLTPKGSLPRRLRPKTREEADEKLLAWLKKRHLEWLRNDL